MVNTSATLLRQKMMTHDRGNCKLLLLRIFEQFKDIISNNNALFSAEYAGCHCDEERGIEKPRKMNIQEGKLIVVKNDTNE